MIEKLSMKLEYTNFLMKLHFTKKKKNKKEKTKNNLIHFLIYSEEIQATSG